MEPSFSLAHSGHNDVWWKDNNKQVCSEEYVNKPVDIMVDLVSKNWNTHYSNLLQWIEYVNLSNYSRKKQVYGGLNDRGMPVA